MDGGWHSDIFFRAGKCRVVRRPSTRPRLASSHPRSLGHRCAVSRGRLPTTVVKEGVSPTTAAKEDVHVSPNHVRSFAPAHSRPLTHPRVFSSCFAWIVCQASSSSSSYAAVVDTAFLGSHRRSLQRRTTRWPMGYVLNYMLDKLTEKSSLETRCVAVVFQAKRRAAEPQGPLQEEARPPARSPSPLASHATRWPPSLPARPLSSSSGTPRTPTRRTLPQSSW